MNNNSYIPWYAPEYVGPVMRNKNVKDYLHLTPQEIKKILENRVVNQEEACKRIAIIVYQHLHGVRFVKLLAGPTGSGKTFIAENLKNAFPDLVYIDDISNLTQEGWKGDKKVSSLFKDVHNPVAYNGVIYPIMFFDECDKLFLPKITSEGGNHSADVQGELLSVVSGTELKIENKKDSRADARIIDTSKISILFAGAFDKQAHIVAESKSESSLGFGATGKKVTAYSNAITIEDVQAAGAISEMCGRIQDVICLNRMTEDDFRKILDITDRGPVYEMQKAYGITICLSNIKKDELAHEACTSGYGFRGIKNSIRKYIEDLIWEDCEAKELYIE